jgi:hypothetical protein
MEGFICSWLTQPGLLSMLEAMEFTEMIKVATSIRTRRKPKTNDERLDFVTETSTEVDEVISALEAMLEKARELFDLIEEAGDTETLQEFKDDYIDPIRDYAQELADLLTGTEQFEDDE